MFAQKKHDNPVWKPTRWYRNEKILKCKKGGDNQLFGIKNIKFNLLEYIIRFGIKRLRNFQKLSYAYLIYIMYITTRERIFIEIHIWMLFEYWRVEMIIFHDI